MHYAPCFNCDVKKAECLRRIELRAALAGLSVTSVKFRCDVRKAKFEPGQRVAFTWTLFDNGSEWHDDGLPLEFFGTVLREAGPKFVVQVDKGKDAGGEGVEASDVFKKNDQLLIKVRPAHMRALDDPARIICPTCYLVEGAAEDRCYANGYYSPSVCMSGAIVQARIGAHQTEPVSAEIPEGYF